MTRGPAHPVTGLGLGHGVKHQVIVLRCDVAGGLLQDGVLKPPPDLLTVDPEHKR